MKEDDPTRLDRCGAFGVETPRWDPFRKEACDPHDKEVEKDIATGDGASVWVTFRDFTWHTLKVGAKSIYGVIFLPAYLVVGGVGGAIRQTYLKVKRKK